MTIPPRMLKEFQEILKDSTPDRLPEKYKYRSRIKDIFGVYIFEYKEELIGSKLYFELQDFYSSSAEIKFKNLLKLSRLLGTDDIIIGTTSGYDRDIYITIEAKGIKF